MIFCGVIRTTDGSAWSVAFSALSWEDALSIGESMGVSDIGLSLGTMEDDSDELDAPVQHFAAWHYREGRFINEDRSS
jgi:hypothetical protein